MITISFMSGIIAEFDDLFNGAKIYNLKRSICDWLDEKENENNGYETDISLVHLYDMENNELDNNEELTDNYYKAFVNRYDIRIIYVKNGNVYYHRSDEPKSDDDPQICEDLSNLQETNTIKYYFDELSFLSSWKKTPSFFYKLGYRLRDADNYFYFYNNNIYPSEDEYDDEDDEKIKYNTKIKYHTDSCLRLIFPKIKLKYFEY